MGAAAAQIVELRRHLVPEIAIVAMTRLACPPIGADAFMTT